MAHRGKVNARLAREAVPIGPIETSNLAAAIACILAQHRMVTMREATFNSWRYECACGDTGPEEAFERHQGVEIAKYGAIKTRLRDGLSDPKNWTQGEMFEVDSEDARA